jgi:hypothetical protein
LACSHLGNRASLVVPRLVYVAVCLKMTNRHSGRSGAVGNMAPAAGRNTKSTAETALVSSGPWHNRYLAWHCDWVALRVNPMPTSRVEQLKISKECVVYIVEQRELCALRTVCFENRVPTARTSSCAYC